MKPIDESKFVEAEFEEIKVPLLEETDLVRGGEDGESNAPTLALAKRTVNLNTRLIMLEAWKKMLTDEDADNVVNTMVEMLAMFKDMPENAGTILEQLQKKADANAVYTRVETNTELDKKADKQQPSVKYYMNNTENDYAILGSDMPTSTITYSFTHPTSGVPLTKIFKRKIITDGIYKQPKNMVFYLYMSGGFHQNNNYNFKAEYYLNNILIRSSKNIIGSYKEIVNDVYGVVAITINNIEYPNNIEYKSGDEFLLKITITTNNGAQGNPTAEIISAPSFYKYTYLFESANDFDEFLIPYKNKLLPANDVLKRLEIVPLSCGTINADGTNTQYPTGSMVSAKYFDKGVHKTGIYQIRMSSGIFSFPGYSLVAIPMNPNVLINCYLSHDSAFMYFFVETRDRATGSLVDCSFNFIIC